MVIKPSTYLLSVALSVFLGWNASSQVTEHPDSLKSRADSVVSFHLPQNSSDSIQSANDSTKNKSKKKSELTTKIEYTAQDSMAYSADHKRIYLYGNAVVKYGDITLKADYIDYDFTSQVVYASGLPDSTGKIIGKPEFTQKNEKFKSEKLNYNFKTKKGIIYNIVTDQQGGYLHAQKTKRQDNGQIDIKNGKYTTCDAEHPHYYLALKKGVVIPNDKIVFRGAYLVIEDVPIFPLFLPFGFFPNRHTNTSGIIMPTYGDENARGFNLTNGGYYFAINDYTDVRLTGSVYTNGSWSLDATQRYYKRYKWSGNFDFHYASDVFGEKDVTSGPNRLTHQKNFSVQWSHSQDPKKNPSSQLSGNVNYTTTGYDRSQNFANPVAMTTNQKSSSVSYTKTWKNFVLSSNMNLNETNKSSGGQIITGNLPNISFNSLQSFYPFRRKNAGGTLKWYENIGLSYSSSFANNINTTDSSFFTRKTLRTAQNGFQQSIPISFNLKVLKFFNIAPSISYKGILQTEHFIRYDSVGFDPTTFKRYYIPQTDTIHQITYTQGIQPSLSISFNQPWYGMFVFGKNSKISKIRHVITPSIGFSYVPPINKLVPNYYRTYYANDSTPVSYSIYDGTLYGTPPVAQRSGFLSFGLNNNLEMKVKSAKDTVTGEKKVVLIQSLNFSASYNLFAKTQKLSNINFSGTLPIIKNLNFNFNGSINPYATAMAKSVLTGSDSLLYYTNDYAWQRHQWGNLTNFGFTIGYSFQSGKGGSTSNSQPGHNPVIGAETQNLTGPRPEQPVPNAIPVTDYNYFKIPWSFNFNYSFTYANNPLRNRFKSAITQNLNFNGNFSLTPKWKINFSSAYDFQTHQISYNYTQFTIARDLHCWAMSISVTPFGNYRNYSFTIHVLSSLLRDLKYEKHHSPTDNPGYSTY